MTITPRNFLHSCYPLLAFGRDAEGHVIHVRGYMILHNAPPGHNVDGHIDTCPECYGDTLGLVHARGDGIEFGEEGAVEL